MHRLNFVAFFSAQTADRPERRHRAPLRSGRSVHQATSLRKSKEIEAIGRRGETGPLRKLHLPGRWLNFDGRNVLVPGLQQTVNGTKASAVKVSSYPSSRPPW